jgi:membrane-bound lytic murein transglycosylase MltF
MISAVKFFSVFLSIILVASVPASAQKARVSDALVEHANKPWKGDLDGMVERGVIRILSVHNPLFFGFDGKTVRGIAVDVGVELEKYLRATLGKQARGMHVVFIPVARDQLISSLLSGRGDMVMANLTITDARRKLVDFSDPTYPNVNEIVVTGPKTQQVRTFDDLIRIPIRVRASSSYFEHLSRLNRTRRKAGKKPLQKVKADERLEDYDLLEMVNAGLIPAVIVDSHKATFWRQVFKKIRVHENLAVHRGSNIAWAFRKKSPKLEATLNRFTKIMRKGSFLGNVILRRYLATTDWIDNIRSPGPAKRFQANAAFFKRYAGQYDFDWLMIAAQGYQESKLDQTVRSNKGAIGIMQLLPTTASDKNVNIPDIHEAEHNIHAGVKYLRFLRNRYFKGPEISALDRALFSFAAYNAGPRAIARARMRAQKMGFNSNVWFNNVEVAAAATISHEPVVYVRNIYKYYVMYKQLTTMASERESAKKKMNK